FGLKRSQSRSSWRCLTNGAATYGLTRRHEPRRCRYRRRLIYVQKSPNRKSLRFRACRAHSVNFIHDGRRVGALGDSAQVGRTPPALAASLPPAIYGRTVQSDLCRKWAEVMMAAQAVGRRIECADAWIAATPLLYDAPLITHNRTDYVGVPGLILVS